MVRRKVLAADCDGHLDLFERQAIVADHRPRSAVVQSRSGDCGMVEAVGPRRHFEVSPVQVHAAREVAVLSLMSRPRCQFVKSA